MKLTLCQVCGDDGKVDDARSTSTFAHYRRLLGPRWRPTPRAFREFLCFRCERNAREFLCFRCERNAHYQIRALEAAREARVAAGMLVAS